MSQILLNSFRMLVAFVRSVITTSTNSLSTAYSNQKKNCTLSNGREVVLVNDTSSNAKIEWSDDGMAWTDYTSDIAGWSQGSIFPYVDSGGTERLVAVWKQSGTGGSRTTGLLYAMVGTFNAGRTTLTWGTASEIGGAGFYGATEPSLDMVAHPEGTGGYIHVVIDHNAQHIYRSTAVITGATIGAWANSQISASGGGYSPSGWLAPSIDINLSDKRIHIAWSAATTGVGKGIRYRTAAYSAGTWTLATEVEVDNAYYLVSSIAGLVCRWDGTRVVIGGLMKTATPNSQIVIWDSTSFTAFTSRIVSGALVDPNIVYGIGLAVDGITGDVYFFGCIWNGSAYANVVYIKMTRSGTALSLGTKITTETFVGIAGNPVYVFARYYSSSLRWVYTKGSVSPYSITYDKLSV